MKNEHSGSAADPFLAEKMLTSHTALDRILDPANTSITLQTLERAALALGKNLKIELKYT